MVLGTGPGAELAVLAGGAPGASAVISNSSKNSVLVSEAPGQTTECLRWVSFVQVGRRRSEWSFQGKLEISQFLNVSQKTFFKHSGKPVPMSLAS